MFLTIVAFIFILALLILAHEFGHFIAAKKSGVKVEEFGFGFPPRIFGIKKGETVYSVNALPLGGFVKMLGELERSHDKRALENQSRFKRFMISVSGVVMNLVLAWLLLTIGFSIGMAPVASPSSDIPGKRLSNEVIVADFSENSPAKDAGIVQGDTIKSISVAGDKLNLTDFSQLNTFTKEHYNQTADVVISHDGESLSKQVKLSGANDAPLGVLLVEQSVIRVPIYDAVWVAARETYRIAVFTFEFLGQYLHALFTTGKAGEGVGGPVAIYTYTGMFVKMGIMALLQFVALLSINLALVNILPLPALDGGRIIFILIETIARKRLIKEKVENIIHTAGFVFLLLLIALITYQDIVKLIKR